MFYFHVVFLTCVAAARQIVFSREQNAFNSNQAWAYRKKVSPASGIKFSSGAIGFFTSIKTSF
jgi:hypothetical protein